MSETLTTSAKNALKKLQEMGGRGEVPSVASGPLRVAGLAKRPEDGEKSSGRGYTVLELTPAGKTRIL